MATKAIRFERHIYLPGGIKIVKIGRMWRQSCTTLPTSLQEARDLILDGPNSQGDTFRRGAGDDFILKNPCELKYYLQGKLIAHLK